VTVTSPAWPSAVVTGPPTFSWSWPADAPPVNWYNIYVWDRNTNTQMMSVNNLPPTQTSIVYNGPNLVPGHQYDYSISSGIGSSNSIVNGNFTFNSAGAGAISLNGILKGNTGSGQRRVGRDGGKWHSQCHDDCQRELYPYGSARRDLFCR
jgi:hypothetical protein